MSVLRIDFGISFGSAALWQNCEFAMDRLDNKYVMLRKTWLLIQHLLWDQEKECKTITSTDFLNKNLNNVKNSFPTSNKTYSFLITNINY